MKNDTVSAPVFLCVLAALGVFAVFSTGCGTTIDAGKVLTAITNAIPHGATTTTTTQPAQTGGTVPAVPQASTNKPRVSDDMVLNYVASGTGIDIPAMTSAHWHFPSPDNVFESGKGYERVRSATWSIVGTNYPATFSGGYCLCTNVHASGLINPIALTITGQSGAVWEYTIWQPSISPKPVKGVRK